MEFKKKMESPQETHSSEKIILVIDDNRDQLFLSKTVLEIQDYKVYTALGGNDSFDLLNRIPQPDLILLDMQMQDMSGPEFLLQLEKTRPEIYENVPVVFFTAMDRVPESKAVGFIQKLGDFDKFLGAVRGFIEKGSGRAKWTQSKTISIPGT